MSMLVESKEEFLKKLDETPIDDLDLSVRSYVCLLRAGIKTVGELFNKSPKEIYEIKDLPQKCYEEILYKLNSWGLSITNSKKIKAIQCLLDNPDNVGAYYKLLEDMGGIKINYRDYMITEPIDCDVELERLATADWDLTCALLTMLLREDHFSNGSFTRRQRKGQVNAILNRMIKLLTNANE